MELNECIYSANVPVKYVYEKAQILAPEENNYLVVVFSGFNAPESTRQHSYNYMHALQPLVCVNRLYILDSYGPRGCYYIGNELKLDVESSVISLILWICRQNNIPWNHVITASSSKGGSAALYFGLKYNVGHVVSGAPQIFIADYIKQTAPETLAYLIGSDLRQDRYNELNNLILMQLDKPLYTAINILSSEHDWQYAHHIRPFMDILSARSIPCCIKVDNTIGNHSEIGTYYPPYLQNYVLQLLYGFRIDGMQYSCDATSLSADINASLPDDIQLKYSVYKGNSIVDSQMCTQAQWRYVPAVDGIYQIRSSFFYKDQLIFESLSNQMPIGKNVLHISQAQLSNEGTRLNFFVDSEASGKLKYAFYVLKNGTVLEKHWYQDSNTFTCDIRQYGNGKYCIQYFILLEDGTKIIEKSNAVSISV